MRILSGKLKLERKSKSNCQWRYETKWCDQIGQNNRDGSGWIKILRIVAKRYF